MITKWNDKQLLDAAQKNGKDYVQKLCYMVERAAKTLVPVDTGNLRRSITNEVNVHERVITGIVGSNVKYSIHVELGTKKMTGRPYLRPALYGVIGYKGGSVQQTYNFEEMVADFVRYRA